MNSKLKPIRSVIWKVGATLLCIVIAKLVIIKAIV